MTWPYPIIPSVLPHATFLHAHYAAIQGLSPSDTITFLSAQGIWKCVAVIIFSLVYIYPPEETINSLKARTYLYGLLLKASVL